MPDRTALARSDVGRPDRGASDLGTSGHDALDSEGMRRLEARLAAARARRAPPAPMEEHFSQANVAWRMVIELVSGIGIGLGIGLGLDALLGTRPLMLVVFVLLGFAAGVRVMMRTAEEIGREAMETEAEMTTMAGARDGG